MARPNILKQIEAESGQPLDALIPSTIEQTGGIYQAALSLGVAPNTIQNWLETNGYSVFRTVKVKRISKSGKGAA